MFLKRRISIGQLLEKEVKGCFEYFWNEADNSHRGAGYGLIHDRCPTHRGIASIAAVGFGLAALCIGAERGYRAYREIENRVSGTLDTLLNSAENCNGFFYHFLDMKTGKRAWNCEVSIIDTAIAICGAISAGEYFGGEIKEKAEAIYRRVDWKWYVDASCNQFYMGYKPEGGFWGHWDEYAEQLMLYFLGSASPTHPTDPGMFYAYPRTEGYYGEIGPVIHSTSGSLFVYQFSHAFFDLRNKQDSLGVDWWQNSVNATLANRQYCIDNSDIFRTYGENAWGLTACDGPGGYSGIYGAPPRKTEKLFGNIHYGNDGTVPPCGPAGSMVFDPEHAQEVLIYMYENHPRLWGKYGFKDALNTSVSPVWYARDYVGIDKGISMLMIENYLSGFIWNVFMKNSFVRKGMELCQVTEKSGLLMV